MNDPISRQAAIEAIDVLKRNYPSSCFEDLCKAVDIAIKALSAQSEPSAVARDIATIIENEKDMRVIASAQPLVLTCDGCRHVGTYDTDFPCSVCIRREKDYYEQER